MMRVENIFMHPTSSVTKDFLNHLTPSENDSVKNLVRWSDDGGKYILRFPNQKTDLPILSQTAKLFDIEYNIRAGGIQKLQESKVGSMLIDFIGSEAEIQKALDYLTNNGVEVEKNESDN